jgi:hypothetical protein
MVGKRDRTLRLEIRKQREAQMPRLREGVLTPHSVN